MSLLGQLAVGFYTYIHTYKHARNRIYKCVQGGEEPREEILYSGRRYNIMYTYYIGGPEEILDDRRWYSKPIVGNLARIYFFHAAVAPSSTSVVRHRLAHLIQYDCIIYAVRTTRHTTRTPHV